MGLQEFRIEFDKSNATYAPGDAVTGKVFLVLSSPKKMREMILKAKGLAEVHWTETFKRMDSMGRWNNNTNHYGSSENYFDLSITLVDPPDGHSQMTLEAGSYTYPFLFRIPSSVPCSFEHTIGHVRYTVKAVIDRPWRFDHKVMIGFTVIADYDLNAHPELLRGIHDRIERQFHTCLCFGNAGNLSVVATTNVQGFVPGEPIELKVAYHNTSDSVDLEGMKLTLRKEISFHATDATKTKRDIVKMIIVDRPFFKDGEQLLRLRVPSMAPSILQNCQIIDISYYLDFKIETSGMHRSINHTYPIQIGTIPLYHRVTNQVPPAVTVPSAPPMNYVVKGNQQSLPDGWQAPQSRPLGFVIESTSPYDMPPPSYEQCFRGSKVIGNPDERGSSAEFAPRYPVYKFPDGSYSGADHSTANITSRKLYYKYFYSMSILMCLFII